MYKIKKSIIRLKLIFSINDLLSSELSTEIEVLTVVSKFLRKGIFYPARIYYYKNSPIVENLIFSIIHLTNQRTW